MANTKNSHKWQREDMILTLDFYLSNRGQNIEPSDPRLLELTSKLNSLPVNKGNNPLTPSSVKIKLVNYMALDQEYKGKGFGNITKKDEAVWEEFSSAAVILSNLAKAISSFAGDQGPWEDNLIRDDGQSFSTKEGKLLSVTHLSRERSPELVQKKKRLALKTFGRLDCEVCGFNFQQKYGEHGKNFIEAHHIKPLASLSRETVIELKDLALVCANCHRMIHAEKKWLTIEELKDIIQS